MRLFLLAVLLVFLGWDAAWLVLGIKPRFPWQLKESLRAGASDLVLLDVRTRLEYNWFHLPGALNVPEGLADHSALTPVPPSKEVVVICLTGHRAPLVAYALKKRGYPRVYNLTGGMLGWKIYEWWSQVWGPREPPPPGN
jgi:rhodanese-related sulfurtransferase